MRIAKKIIFVALAILPLFTLLQISLFSANDKQNQGVDEILDVAILGYTENDETIEVRTVYTTGDSDTGALIDFFMLPYLDFTASDQGYTLRGYIAALFKLNVYLYENVGIPICGSTFGALLLLSYYAFLGLAEMLVDLITFVPRKVSEIFK